MTRAEKDWNQAFAISAALHSRLDGSAWIPADTWIRVEDGRATVSIPADALLDLLARVDAAPVRPS